MSKFTIAHYADPSPNLCTNPDVRPKPHTYHATCTSAVLLAHASPTITHAYRAKHHPSIQLRAHAAKIPDAYPHARGDTLETC